MATEIDQKSLIADLVVLIDGDVEADEETLEKYSRDASLFKVRPQVVVFPKHREDVGKIIAFVNENQEKYPGLALTGRAAGTDMTGAAIGEGIIMSFTRYLNKDEVDVAHMEAVVEPGVFFRDFEKDTLPKHVSMPVYPASKSLAALGGMIMNNCGGEKTLRYGQIREFIKELHMVLVDSKEHNFKKLTMPELKEKMAQKDFEGEIYRKTFKLIDENYDLIQQAKPQTAKNSSGYALWRVYDKEAGTFDLTHLFVGSQGTLGVMTDAKMRLVEHEDTERLVVLFFKNWDVMPDVINELLPLDVESMETFDDTTMRLGIRFMPEIAKQVGISTFSLLMKFLPEAIISLRMFRFLPKLLVLVEISQPTEEKAEEKVQQVLAAVKKAEKKVGKVYARVARDEQDAEKYWTMRRKSFALLRKHVGDKKSAPFIDDVCVLPEKLPEFLPKLLKILDDHDISVNIAGHAGSGNLHIIPLMRLDLEEERAKIPVVLDKVSKLVIEYGGTNTAEHNDGIVRTPYVKDQFGEEVYGLFEEVKNIFDPQNIFNPGKKVGGTKEYLAAHIAGE